MDTQYQKEKENFAIVSLDESFIFYDSLVRRVWIDREKRPVVRVTGSLTQALVFVWSHKYGRKTAFQTVWEIQRWYLSWLSKGQSTQGFHGVIFSWKSFTSPQVKEGKRLHWTEQGYTYSRIPSNRLSWVYDARGGMEYIQKRDLLILEYYPSFEDFKEKISRYFRTKRFNLNMRNYLLRMV